MARLEIDLSVRGAEGASSKVDNFAKKIEGLNQSISGFSKQQMHLQKEFRDLNNSFQQGTISESKFRAENQRLSVELSKNASNLLSAQSRLKSFKATMDQATNSSRSLGNAQKQLQGYSNDFTTGIRSANSVAVEFSRIIQDAPYGMQGVANNIQQLTQNWAYYTRAAKEAAAAQGQTIGRMGLLRGALGAMLSPINLLTLGISAVTAGWVAYERWQQRANKAAKESTDAMQEMIKALGNVSTSMYNAATASGAELAELRLLYQASTDASKGTQERTKAAQQLINKYPDLFKEMGTEKILLGQAKTAYDQLSTSILATARAQAAYGRIGEKSSQQLAIDETNRNLRTQLELEKQRLVTLKQVNAASTPSTGYGTTNVLTDTRVISQQQKINGIQNNINNNLLERAKLQEDILQLEDLALSNQGKMIVNDKERNKQLGNTVDLLQAVKNLRQQSDFSVDVATSDEGLDTLLTKNTQKYKKYLDELDALEKKTRGAKRINNRDETLNEISSTRQQILANQLAEEAQIRIKFAQETADKISQIEDKAGIDRNATRKAELDRNESYYNEQERQFRNNADILTAIVEARRVSEQKINEKWDNKAYQEVNKQRDRIEKIINKPFSDTASNDKIQQELDKRLKQIDDYYKKIADILRLNNLPTVGLGVMQTVSKAQVISNAPTNNDDKNLEKRLGKVVERGLRRGIDDIFNNITGLGSNFYEVFSNVFQKLATTVTNTFGNVLNTQLGNLLSTKINDKDFSIGGLGSNTSKAIVAGGGILGGILSSQGAKKNNAGMMIGGGALSGAAAGAAFGPWGAAIGAVVGAISGIFQSAGAKKQQKLQEEQLAEQRKQTALAERAAALAYTSSITGQMTNAGIVNSVDRDAFGNLVATIKGSDIQLVLDRSKNNR